MHPSRFFIFAIIFFCAVGKVFAFPFGFPGTDPDHIPKDPFKKEYYTVNSCFLTYNGKFVDLATPAANYEKAYELIAQTPTGRLLLKKYKTLNAKDPFQYKELNYSLRRELNMPVKIGAAFIFQGKEKTIYYDPEDNIGLLAIFLSHELMHAVDPDVLDTYFKEMDAWKQLPREDYERLHQQNSFRIERRAFDMQDIILIELLKLTPCYGSFIQQHRDEGGLKLFNPTPDSYIRDAYGIAAP